MSVFKFQKYHWQQNTRQTANCCSRICWIVLTLLGTGIFCLKSYIVIVSSSCLIFHLCCYVQSQICWFWLLLILIYQVNRLRPGQCQFCQTQWFICCCCCQAQLKLNLKLSWSWVALFPLYPANHLATRRNSRFAAPAD